MNPGDRELALRLAVGEWQKRHGLSDHDPLLGVVELFRLFLSSLDKDAGFPSQKAWEELWDSVEILSLRAKALSKQIDDMSSGTCNTEEPNANIGIVFLLAALLFIAGFALGRWWG